MVWTVWLSSFLGTALGFSAVYCALRYSVRLNNLIFFGKFTRDVDLAEFGLGRAKSNQKRLAGEVGVNPRRPAHRFYRY